MILIYNLSKHYSKRYFDRVVIVVIYSLLPGVNSSALILNETIFIVFLTLLFINLYLSSRYRLYSYIPLILTLFLDNSSLILMLSLFIYSIKRDKLLKYITLTLFLLSMYIYGFEVGGKPKCYLLDTFGLYLAIFSPALFIYYFYTLYRILIKGDRDILWYIAFYSLVISLTLSFRQRVEVEDFAPYLIVATPVMIKQFLSSYRVRIEPFKRFYRNLAILLLSTLLLSSILIFYNQLLYYLLKNPKDNFAYKFHIAKELAIKLKDLGINSIYCKDRELSLRLKFYSIGNQYRYRLSKEPTLDGKKVSIFHTNIEIASFYVTKTHIK